MDNKIDMEEVCNELEGIEALLDILTDAVLDGPIEERGSENERYVALAFYRRFHSTFAPALVHIFCDVSDLHRRAEEAIK